MALTSETDGDGPRPAPDFGEAADPFELFHAWLDDAEAHERNDANAMTVATVDAQGLPNARILLLKGVDGSDAGAQRGFVWFTNYESAKGIELTTNPRAALLFHWKSLRRQVRVRGGVNPIPAAEGDDYFATRPRGSQIGAWASRQSRPLRDMAELEAAVDDVARKYPEGATVPRPPHWSGFRLVPLEMEFWHDRPYRLHERVVFTRQDVAAGWTRKRLFP